MVTDSKQPYARQARVALVLACLILIVEASLLIHTRWVEDESWLASGGQTLLQEGRLRSAIFPGTVRAEVDASPPVHTWALATSFRLFGVGVTPARAVSAAAAVGLLCVIFVFAARIGGPLCAAAAVVLLATDTFLVIAARTARAEALVALLCWLALLVFYEAARLESKKLFLLSGLLLGVAFATHPLSLPFAAAIGIFFLARYGWSALRRPYIWLFAAAAALPIALYAGWCFQDAAHIAAFRDSYLAKAADPWRERIFGEADRWGDFIGLSTQRVALPVRIPVRLHVVVILLAAFAFLFRRKREIAAPLAVVLLANMLWWVYLVNKGPRYLVMISPVFALLMGYLVAKARELGAKRAIYAAATLLVATQVAGNAYWLYKFRRADYVAVERQLRQLIPPGAKVFGATTFWMALHDHPYYAYDRTKLDYAVEKLQPEYFILNDRVMVHGSGHGEDDFAELRARANAFVRQHGALAGQVHNDFYGDLEIFRVSY